MKRKMERISALLLIAIALAVLLDGTKVWSYRDPKMRVWPEFIPNDPYWIYQWGPRKIEADWAWNVTFGDSSILVAVIDSGIDYNHPDLATNYVGLGYDWINLDPDPLDDYGHGTQVAGIIAAEINNGIGIAGLAQVKIMAEKVLDNRGEGYVDQLANGIIHATNMGAKIISISLSTEYNGSLLYDAVRYAYDAGVLIVAAAGNQANDTKRYPAAYDEVIAVIATDENDEPASFSNFGDWVEFAAPGVNIFTTALPNENLPLPYRYYRYGSGTSFACPHVSGLAALIWSEFPDATRDWVRNRLRETTDDLGDPGFDIFFGYGRINARRAIHGNPPAINYTLTITTTMGGTTNPPPGNYTYLQGQKVLVQSIPDVNYIFDHWEIDTLNIGCANPLTLVIDANHTLEAFFTPGVHNLAVTNVKPFKTVVGQGCILNINVTIENQGNFPEIFNLTVYVNATEIEMKKNISISEGPIIINFFWNTTGFAKGNYIISAYAWPVPGETETADNNLTDGFVIVAMIGDITGPDGWPDGKCDMRDVGLVARYFGQNVPPAPSKCDLTGPARIPDGKIDMLDISLVAKQFGKIDP